MVDLQGKDKGNISLPPQLQSPDMATCSARDLEDQPFILNMQRAMYKTLINDQELKIERLQARNYKLEDFIEYVNNYTEDESSESENVLVELNTNIAFQIKKVDELKRRYDEVEKRRQERIAEHEKTVNKIKENFEETERKLSSEIKLLRAKINTLEDFKSAEEALVAKLTNNNEYIIRKEEELEDKLKDFEFKTKVHRENLKKETYKQVLETSKDFQTDLRTTIPLTVQRMLRENIILENELFHCWNDHANISDQKLNYEESFRKFYDKIKESKLHTKPRLVTLKIQHLLIERLKKAHSSIKQKLSETFEAPDNFEGKYQQILDSTNKPEFTDNDCIRRKLEIVLHQERIKLALANQFKSKTSFALNACCNALSIMKYAVNTAASGEGEIVDIEGFGSYLLDVIQDCNSKKWIAPTESLETVDFSSNVYPKGDLGFEPEHVEIIEPLIKKTEKRTSRSIMSTLEILEELEKLQKISERKRVSETRSRDTVSLSESTDSKDEKSRTSVRSADDKGKDEKLQLFYDEIFGDEDFEYEEMEDQYDDYLNYEQE